VNPRRPFETITVRDKSASVVGTATYDRTVDGIYTVGTFHVETGDNWVTVQCSRPAMLDCWILDTPAAISKGGNPP